MSARRRRAAKGAADPYADREARKYERPIPSREFIMACLEERGAPLSQKQLADELGLVDEEQLEALRRRLIAMVRDGQLIRNRRNGYGLVSKMDLVVGRVTGHPDGFGFLVPDAGGDDLFLSPRQMRQLMHGDRAVACVVGMDRRGRREGRVVEVLERNTRELAGRFFVEGGIGLVIPDNKRISHDVLIPAEQRGGAQHGQIVVVEITEQPGEHTQPLGRVIEVLGDHMAPGMEVELAIRAHGLPEAWPEPVLAEIADLTGEVPETAKAGRVDLRDLPLVTIDGADARDFDDAVYCERKGKTWRLLVAIADVSAYVQPGTYLDQEAVERSTSVYFPRRVVPMLPEILSNGLCSLNPQVDRLCMVCEMYVNDEGRVVRSRFFDAVMRSAARLTYDEVAAMLVAREEQVCSQYRDVLPHLETLYAVYHAFRSARSGRGVIEFETTETRIQFDQHGRVKRIVPTERNDAHRIIEECMIAANVCAARFLLRQKMPALYRIHEGPTVAKLADLRAFLGELGLQLGGGDAPEARHYGDLLSQVQGRPDRHLIQTVLLRSLSQAVYSPDNVGHFGLAHEAYAHFTSPIRRYPDLMVHRAIRYVSAGGNPDAFDYTHADMQGLGEHCSMRERRADEASRDAVDWLKCEYMQDKVGEEFDGLITGVTGFGIFVELVDIYVEGLVHVTALEDDYYHFDPSHHRLRGEHTGIIYRLADTVRVRVVRVDLDERKIDFALIGRPAGKKGRGKKAAPASSDGAVTSSKSGQRKTVKAKRKAKTKTEGREAKKPKARTPRRTAKRGAVKKKTAKSADTKTNRRRGT